MECLYRTFPSPQVHQCQTSNIRQTPVRLVKSLQWLKVVHESNSPSCRGPGIRSPPSAGIFLSAVLVSPWRRTGRSCAGPASRPWCTAWQSDESRPPASSTGLRQIQQWWRVDLLLHSLCHPDAGFDSKWHWTVNIGHSSDMRFLLPWLLTALTPSISLSIWYHTVSYHWGCQETTRCRST